MQIASSESSGGEPLLLATIDTAHDADVYPVGSRVEIYWKGDEEWYAATVLKTRVTTKTVSKARVPCREILCHYDLDGVIQWYSLHNTTIRETSEPPPAVETSDVDDPFPRGSRVEVYWKDDKVWYRATVLTTRTNWHKIQGVQTLCREIYCEYDLDGHMQWHSLHNNRVRTGSASTYRNDLNPSPRISISLHDAQPLIHG